MSVALASPPCERLTPLERLEVLCDPGSLQLLRTGVRSRRMAQKARDGDGVLAASGLIDGRPVAVFAQDATFAGGSLGQAHADTVVELLRLAERSRIPVIGCMESAGARMQEGLAALGGYGRIFRHHVALSGRVPQISIVCGACAGGGSYGPALTDFVVMTEQASMFLTGPGVVAKVTGEEVDAAELGGPRVHDRNGVCHMAAPSDLDALLLTRELLDHLPQRAGERPARRSAVAAPTFAPDLTVPAEERKVYDVRDVARALVDGGHLLEVSPRYARNVVCAFARIEGRSVGIVANQPRHLGGVLDSDAAQKAARFVGTCNMFGVALVVLVDTPGFLPGVKQERGGVIRHGAKLVHAFAECVVPRVTVVLRKGFGGAVIAMNSKQLGADFVFAWPQSQLGVMGSTQAVEIVNRREIAAAANPQRARERFAAAYAREHLAVDAAAAEGFVDEIIAPAETRACVAGSLATLDAAAWRAPAGGNIPL
ncbi:MAG TPA: acyl-CoA carboxylase subunit beta [Solirubrobacteraceae bacterium]|jgi:acetyl-CoA carboxylase carboxyltransferase component|nr:acyl-CoA carboxylase subunit beta [Solirubrobacteraceae bacterium]